MPPDRWLVVTVNIDPASVPGEVGASEDAIYPDSRVEGIPEALIEIGGLGVEERGGSFATYVPPPENLEEFLQDVGARMDLLTDGCAEVHWSWLPQEDWDALWRIGLGPRRITPRLLVAPSWKTPEVGSQEILIVMDPGMAFGTAEHGTTRGCLRLLESRVKEGDRIADVGSGSGILSIAASRLGAKEVLALEADPVACAVSEENLVANGVGAGVRIVNEEVTGAAPIQGAPYDGIVANIQSLVLLPLLPTFRSSLVPGAWLILSGILAEERDVVLEAASEESLFLDEEDRDGEWWSAAFRLPEANR